MSKKINHPFFEPKFQELPNKLSKGEMLTVCDVSRLDRKTRGVLDTFETLQDKVVVIFVDQLNCIDIASGVGKLLFTMLSDLAELEREIMLERQRIGIYRTRAEVSLKGVCQ